MTPRVAAARRRLAISAITCAVVGVVAALGYLILVAVIAPGQASAPLVALGWVLVIVALLSLALVPQALIWRGLAPLIAEAEGSGRALIIVASLAGLSVLAVLTVSVLITIGLIAVAAIVPTT